MVKEDMAYRVSVEYYTDLFESDSETDGIELVVIAKSYSEVEKKVLEHFGGLGKIKLIWEISVLDSVLIK